MAFEAGQNLRHYRLIEKIGEGGMGVVWKAHDTTLDRDVAIKVLPDELAADAGRLARFKREAKAVAALNHPNIITVYSVEKEDGGLHFFTMELVGGQRLSQQIPRQGLPLERFLDLAIPLADAISAAHEQGITHRDLKPANIMVTAENRVKVLDFGLAKLVREARTEGPEAPTRSMSLTRDGELMGTFPYMSPEQIEGRAVDRRSDLFSLGVILYEMATGRHPFPGMTPAAVMSAIMKDSPVSVTEHNPELPADLGRIIRHCLQKDPERRYQTAKGLRNELEELRKTSETGAVATAQPSSARSASKPRTTWVALAAVVALAVATPAYLWRRSAPAPDSGVRRIVVLPFENLGPPADAYFTSGMTDEIHGRLAVVSGLGVISRTSAMRYAGTTKTIREIGDELAVGYVLEGTVRRDREGDDGGRVRVTPRLIRVVDDTDVWADAYDRRIEDVFSVQSEIAEQIVKRLGLALLEPERRAMDAIPTRNLDAYEAYLRGKYYQFSGTHGTKDVAMALEMFQRAVDLDPDFTLALAKLSEAHSMFYHYGLDRSEGRAKLAKDTIDRALALEPDSPRVHLALARFYYWVHRDYDRALAQCAIAGKARPNDGGVLGIKYSVLRRQGRWEEALASARRSYELSPRDPEQVRGIARTLWLMRRYRESEPYFDRLIAIAPDQPVFYGLKAQLYRSWKGTTEEARAVLETMPDTQESATYWWFQLVTEGGYREGLDVLQGLQGPGSPMDVAGRALDEGFVYGLLNESRPARAAYQSAREILEQEARARPEDYFVQRNLGVAYAGLGRKEDAIQAGRRAVDLLPPSTDALQGSVNVQNLAYIHTIVGEYDLAIDEIEYLLSIPSFLSAPLLRLDPGWKPLWDQPRFQELMERYQAG